VIVRPPPWTWVAKRVILLACRLMIGTPAYEFFFSDRRNDSFALLWSRSNPPCFPGAGCFSLFPHVPRPVTLMCLPFPFRRLTRFKRAFSLSYFPLFLFCRARVVAAFRFQAFSARGSSLYFLIRQNLERWVRAFPRMFLFLAGRLSRAAATSYHGGFSDLAGIFLPMVTDLLF